MKTLRPERERGRERGQALLLAIIVLLLLALLSAAMIAIVSSGLEETGRNEQRVRARLLAEAGLRFADEMLAQSPEGADWRPALPPALMPDADTVNKNTGAGDPAFDQALYDATWDSYEKLRGWDSQSVWSSAAGAGASPVYFVKYRFAMDPEALSATVETPTDDPAQDFVDPLNPVEPVENVEETAPHSHFLLKVEYAPNPADPLSRFLKITSIGRPGDQPTAFQELVAYKPLGLQDYLLFLHDRTRGGSTATLGLPAVDIDGDRSTASSNRAASAGGLWSETGDNDFLPLFLEGPVRSNVNLTALAPLRFRPSEPGGWAGAVEVAGSFQQAVDTAATGGNAEVIFDQGGGVTEIFENATTGPVASTQPTTPVSGNPWPTGLEVGVARRVEAPGLEVYEPATGVSRWDRLSRYSGVELAALGVNSGELGYGRGIYIDNREQVDLLDTAPNAWLRPEAWGGRRFEPEGVIVELFAHYPEEPTSADADPTDNPPAIVITRTDGTTWLNPSTNTDTGSRTMVFDFPDKVRPLTFTGDLGPRPVNGLIVAEGNVRIRGRLPESYPGGGQQDYNLTVVSRGSIFIEGPLLRPSDYSGVGENTPQNTRIALLARDHIVINPTALALGPVPGLAPGGYTVPRDRPQDAHFVVAPNGATAVGIPVPICYQHELNPANGNVNLSVPPMPAARLITIQADGNVNDGVAARSTVTVARYRNQVGDQPAAGGPWEAFRGQPGSQGIGQLAFFADWANLNRAEYAGSTAEFSPDSVGTAAASVVWNNSLAAGELGIPSWCYVEGAVDWSGGGNEARSDVIVKNMKVQRGGGTTILPGVIMQVSALMYAERGSFHIVPGDWFDPRAETRADVRDGVDDDTARDRLARLRRFNYQVAIRGAICVNDWAPLTEVGDWTDKWAYPDPAANDPATVFHNYQSVFYRYDWGLRSTGGRLNRPRLPYLPASPGLVYAGEENRR